MASRRTTSFPPSRPIRLVVVEPSSILGLGLREVIEAAPDIELVAYVNSADEALSLIDNTAPDVVLVDVAIPDADGVDATRRLRQGAPDAALVVLDRGDDASIVEAVEVGAAGHVGARAQPSDLVGTIRRVAEGQDPLVDELAARPDLVERVIDAVRESILADSRPANPLSPREGDVLAGVGRGLRNREIGDELGISEQTVKNHLSSILHKLGVPNRTRAVTYATRHGWLTLDALPAGPAAAVHES
jgi:DNA-binding NarL/FixJ family response regulator